MVSDTLFNVTEDSSDQYMNADWNEYSSSLQPVVSEQNNLSDKQQTIQKTEEEEQPVKASASLSVDVADKVDLPEGLLS